MTRTHHARRAHRLGGHRYYNRMSQKMLAVAARAFGRQDRQCATDSTSLPEPVLCRLRDLLQCQRLQPADSVAQQPLA